MNKIETLESLELISALADGQLHGEAFARGIEAAAADPRARDAWQTYHLIGDVLRSGDRAVGRAPAEFLGRLQNRLVLEPRSASNSIAIQGRPASAPATFDAKMGAANDSSFRWKLVAGVSSVTAVAALSWSLVGGLGSTSGQPQLAGGSAQPATVLAGGERGVMIRDARLDELLAAHRQFGGTSALQMPAGFLRNATFEGPAR